MFSTGEFTLTTIQYITWTTTTGMTIFHCRSCWQNTNDKIIIISVTHIHLPNDILVFWNYCVGKI